MEKLPFDDESYRALTDEEKAKLKEIRERLDLTNPNAVIQFGTDIQNKISEFADTVLSEVRAKDADQIGKILSELMLKLKELNVEGLGGGFLSKLPFVKPLLDNARKFMAGYRNVSVQVLSIVEQLERSKTQLLKDVAVLEGLYERNLGYFKELNLFILAGKMKLLELREAVIPPLEAAAESSGDSSDIQKYKDIVQLAERVERKLYDLELSRAISFQTAPQIRLVQNNNQELAEKIQSSILNTIPLWKNQVIIAVMLLRQKSILEVQREVSQTTRELLLKNAEMIKEGSVSVAREAEAGIVDLETLKKVNADLIRTIEETLRIHQEGKSRRLLAGEEIEKMEQALKQEFMKLKELSAARP